MMPPLAKDVIQPGHTAVVTGASSGIGKAACLHFAKAGMHVFMVDIDEAPLRATYELVISEAQKVAQEDTQQWIRFKIVDVANEAKMRKLANEVFEQSGGQCHLLMNNAGTGLGGGAVTTDMETVHKVMGVNVYGPMHGCLAFVPKMKENSSSGSGTPGIIINTGSKQGIVGLLMPLLVFLAHFLSLLLTPFCFLVSDYASRQFNLQHEQVRAQDVH